MFAHGMKKSNQEVVELKDESISAAALKIVLDSIYSGDLRVNDENVFEVLIAADHLQVTSVIQQCCDDSQTLQLRCTVQKYCQICTNGKLARTDRWRQVQGSFWEWRIHVPLWCWTIFLPSLSRWPQCPFRDIRLQICDENGGSKARRKIGWQQSVAANRSGSSGDGEHQGCDWRTRHRRDVACAWNSYASAWIGFA